MLCRNHVDVAEGVRRCARCGAPYCADCLVEIGGRPYCAQCKSEQLLDVRSGVEASGQLALASRWNRFGALFLDFFIKAIPIGLLLGGLYFMAGVSQFGIFAWDDLFNLLYTIVSVVYEGLMLQFKNGQTLGKMATKVRVVRPDGSPISGAQAWGRVAIRIILGCLIIVD